MSHFSLLLIAMAFASGGVTAQSMPETQNPAPSPRMTPADVEPMPMWQQIEHLPRGQRIKVQISARRWDRCEFGGATDGALFCFTEESADYGRPGPYAAPEWAIDRGRVTGFKLDHDTRNGRLIFAGFVVAGGVWGGARAWRDSRNGGAAIFGGVVGALTGSIPGEIGACAVGHCIQPPPGLFDSHRSYVVEVNLPMHVRQRARH